MAVYHLSSSLQLVDAGRCCTMNGMYPCGGNTHTLLPAKRLLYGVKLAYTPFREVANTFLIGTQHTTVRYVVRHKIESCDTARGNSTSHTLFTAHAGENIVVYCSTNANNRRTKATTQPLRQEQHNGRTGNVHFLLCCLSSNCLNIVDIWLQCTPGRFFLLVPTVESTAGMYHSIQYTMHGGGCSSCIALHRLCDSSWKSPTRKQYALVVCDVLFSFQVIRTHT